MRFIVTKELGRLAKWLRILGFDAEYLRVDKVSTAVIIALRDGRIILTRNSRLGRHGGIKILNIKSDNLKHQIRQIMMELKIKPNIENMFLRCVICNKILKGVDKEQIKDSVPEYVYKTQQDFYQCPMCQRIYWQGTHWGNVKKTLKEISLL